MKKFTLRELFMICGKKEVRKQKREEREGEQAKIRLLAGASGQWIR